MFSPATEETAPTAQGPTAQPMSPKRASFPEIFVPPPGNKREARANAPGHISPTKNPVKLHAVSDKIGCPENPAII